MLASSIFHDHGDGDDGKPDEEFMMPSLKVDRF